MPPSETLGLGISRRCGLTTSSGYSGYDQARIAVIQPSSRMQIGNEYPDQGCAAGYQLEAGSNPGEARSLAAIPGQVDIAGINLLNGPVAQLDDVTFGTGQNFHLLLCEMGLVVQAPPQAVCSVTATSPAAPAQAEYDRWRRGQLSNPPFNGGCQVGTPDVR
jgi:hypothetical protein